MKGFKITNINFHQAVTLPAGTYTYSCKARPVGSSITFRVGITDYVISNLSPGVYQKGIKYTFTVESEQTNFYPSRTVGDEIFEPQLEEGTKATSAGPNILDEPEALSRAGIQITADMARIYAKKGDVDASITVEAGKITQKVEDVGGRVSTVEQTVDSWSSTIIDSGKIVSQILQEDGTVKIKAEQIELEGSETANGNFIVNVDGTIKAKGAEIEGKIMSSSQGQRVIIDPEIGGLYMYSNEDAVTGELIHEGESMDGLSLSRAYMILRDWVNEDILVGQEQVIWQSIVVKPGYIKIEENDFEGQLMRSSSLFADRLYFVDPSGGVKFGLRIDPTSGITRLTFGNLPDQSAALTGETYIDSNGFIKVK